MDGKWCHLAVQVKHSSCELFCSEYKPESISVFRLEEFLALMLAPPEITFEAEQGVPHSIARTPGNQLAYILRIYEFHLTPVVVN